MGSGILEIDGLAAMKRENADAGFEPLLFPLENPNQAEEEKGSDCPRANFRLFPPAGQDRDKKQVVNEKSDQARAFDVEATGGKIGAPFADANHPKHEAPGGVIEKFGAGREPGGDDEAGKVAGQSEAAERNDQQVCDEAGGSEEMEVIGDDR